MKIENLTVSYPDKRVFENFNVDINGGEITCVLGPSGVGKTTLLNAISGVIESDIEKVSASYVFQEPNLVNAITVYDNLKLVCDDGDKIINALDTVGLLDKKTCYPETLSGGEKQRVNLARAILYGGDIWLLDEPFSSLDIKLKLELYNLFVSLWEKDKKPCVFVTHDIDEALIFAGRIVVLDGSKITLDIKIEKAYPRKLEELAKERNILFSALTN